MAKKILTDDEQRLVDTLQGQMKDNSAAWFNADNETRTKLHNQNTALSQDIDKITGGTTSFDNNTGVWNTQYDESTIHRPKPNTTQTYPGTIVPIQRTPKKMAGPEARPEPNTESYPVKQQEYPYNNNTAAAGVKQTVPTVDINYLNNLKKMVKDNSAAWFDADEATRVRLHNQNEVLMAEIDKYTGGRSDYDPATGKWSTSFSDIYGTRNADGAPSQKVYTPINQEEINNLQDKIVNSKFDYDPYTDPSYKAYADMYRREGDRASKSTLADVATAQGGVSSYAGAAAQQASNYYAQQLTDKIPTLEQLAYEKYSDDLNNKYNLMNMYQNQQDVDYNRFLNDRNYELQLDQMKMQQDQFNQEQENWNKQFEYGKTRDDISDKQFDRQQSYYERITIDEIDREIARENKDFASDLVFKVLGVGQMPDADLLESAGIPQSVADALYNSYWLSKNPYGGTKSMAAINAAKDNHIAQSGAYTGQTATTGYTPTAVTTTTTGATTAATAQATTPTAAQSSTYSAAADDDKKKSDVTENKDRSDMPGLVAPGAKLTENGSVLTDEEWALLDKYHFDENLNLRNTFGGSEYTAKDFENAKTSLGLNDNTMRPVLGNADYEAAKSMLGLKGSSKNSSYSSGDFNQEEFEKAKAAQIKYNNYMKDLDEYVKKLQKEEAEAAKSTASSTTTADTATADTKGLVVPGTQLTDNGSVLTDEEWALLDKYHFNENLMLRDNKTPEGFDSNEYIKAKAAQIKYNKYMKALDEYVKTLNQPKETEPVHETYHPKLYYRAPAKSAPKEAVYDPNKKSVGNATLLYPSTHYGQLVTPEYQKYLDQQAAQQAAQHTTKRTSSKKSTKSGSGNGRLDKLKGKYREVADSVYNSYLNGETREEELSTRLTSLRLMQDEDDKKKNK